RRRMQWTSIPLGPVAMAFAAGIALAPFAPGAAAWAAWGAALGIAIVAVALGRLASAAIPLLVAVAALGALRGMPGPPASDHLANLSLPRSSLVEGPLVGEPPRWADHPARVAPDARPADRASAPRARARCGGRPPSCGGARRAPAPARDLPPAGFEDPGRLALGRLPGRGGPPGRRQGASRACDGAGSAGPAVGDTGSPTRGRRHRE